MSVSSKISSHQSVKSSENITSIDDLRNIALQKLRILESGFSKTDEFLEDIDAFCKITNTILNTLKVEISYLKLINKDIKIKFIEDANVIEGKKG